MLLYLPLCRRQLGGELLRFGWVKSVPQKRLDSLVFDHNVYKARCRCIIKSITTIRTAVGSYMFQHQTIACVRSYI